jgi:hypothetical protein
MMQEYDLMVTELEVELTDHILEIEAKLGRLEKEAEQLQKRIASGYANLCKCVQFTIKQQLEIERLEKRVRGGGEKE